MINLLKKMTVSIIILVLCMVSLASLAAHPVAEITVIEDKDGNLIEVAFGDVDDNTVLSVADIVQWLNYFHHIQFEDYQIDDELFEGYKFTLDCYYDGIIDCKDLTVLIKRVLGEIDSLPIYSELTNPADNEKYEYEGQEFFDRNGIRF